MQRLSSYLTNLSIIFILNIVYDCIKILTLRTIYIINLPQTCTMKCNYTFVLSNCVGQKTTGRVNVYVQNVNDNWPVCQKSVLTASVSELAGTAHGFYLPCTILILLDNAFIRRIFFQQYL